VTNIHSSFNIEIIVVYYAERLYVSIVDNVLCPPFEEIEILISGDSSSIFASVDKMWN